MTIFIIQLLNSFFYAAVLFLIAAGLSLIYGVMRIVNLAHGTLYALSAMRRAVRSALPASCSCCPSAPSRSRSWAR